MYFCARIIQTAATHGRKRTVFISSQRLPFPRKSIYAGAAFVISRHFRRSRGILSAAMLILISPQETFRDARLTLAVTPVFFF